MKDPNYKNDLSFRSMDDSPENDGMNFNDYNPPRATWANQNDEINEEGEEERNDVFGSGYDENTERFD